jgi:hypothetical protein
MLNKTSLRLVLSLGIFIAIAGCVTTADKNRTAQQDVDKKWTAANQAAAPEVLSKEELLTCAKKYKEKMNDPSSFSFAADAAQKQIGGVVGDAVLYSTRIRGKNSFGGIVLSTMNCTFKYDAAAKKLTFVGAWN